MFQLQLNENTLLGKPDATVKLDQQLKSSTLKPKSNRMKNKTKSCSDLLDSTLPLPGTPTSPDIPAWSPVPDVLKSSSQTTALDLPMRTNATKVSSGRLLGYKYTPRHQMLYNKMRLLAQVQLHIRLFSVLQIY